MSEPQSRVPIPPIGHDALRWYGAVAEDPQRCIVQREDGSQCGERRGHGVRRMFCVKHGRQLARRQL